MHGGNTWSKIGNFEPQSSVANGRHCGSLRSIGRENTLFLVNATTFTVDPIHNHGKQVQNPRTGFLACRLGCTSHAYKLERWEPYWLEVGSRVFFPKLISALKQEGWGMNTIKLSFHGARPLSPFCMVLMQFLGHAMDPPQHASPKEQQTNLNHSFGLIILLTLRMINHKSSNSITSHCSKQLLQKWWIPIHIYITSFWMLIFCPPGLPQVELFGFQGPSQWRSTWNAVGWWVVLG